MNIVFFYFDEMRQDALSVYNKTYKMQTPNVERIASKGTVYENCFCTSPICVPSRSSLLTCLYPEKTAIYCNEAAMPSFHMKEAPLTFVKILEQHGYKTANFGKTHVPDSLDQFAENNPEGGEMNLGLSKSERNSLDKITPPGELSFNAASLYPEGKDYYPEKVTENAISWIKKQKGPFFIRISYLQPHSPIILKRGFENIYNDYPVRKQTPEKLSRFEEIFGEICGFSRLSTEEKRKAVSYYYAMVAWLDGEVGKVLDTLDQIGIADDTIIIFNSDHGALRGECGGGLGKHVFNRSAHAVPLIISHPDQKKGFRDARLCSNIDIGVTLLAMLSIPCPETFQGIDIRNEMHDAVYGTIGYGEKSSRAFPMRDLGILDDGSGWPRRSAIRMSHYRLDMNTRINGRNPKPDEEDLFFVDCNKYPDENFNMADSGEYKEIIIKMKNMLLEHIRDAKEVPESYVELPAGLREKSQQ